MQEYVRIGQEVDGANLVFGGEALRIGGGCEGGSFMRPAIFTDCSDEMQIAREEIFGPVMCILDFEDEEEVVQRANDTPYGLSAGVFTNDLQLGHRVISKLESGTTWMNTYNTCGPEIPWGGFKSSGLGQENGPDCYLSWTREKSVYVEMGRLESPYQ